MAEEKIKLEDVIKVFKANKYDADELNNIADENGLKVGEQYFKYKLLLNYFDSREYIHRILSYLDMETHIAYSMREAIEILTILDMCTNLDVADIVGDVDKLCRLPYDTDVYHIISFLKSMNNYDYIESLNREVDIRLQQRQHQLNNQREIDKVIDPFAQHLGKVMEDISKDDVMSIKEVVEKLKSVSQEDIINNVLKLQEQHDTLAENKE